MSADDVDRAESLEVWYGVLQQLCRFLSQPVTPEFVDLAFTAKSIGTVRLRAVAFRL